MSDFKFGNVPLIDIFHRESIRMYVWSGTQVYTLYESVGNNWKTSGWPKCGRIKCNRLSYFAEHGNVIF